MRAAEYQTLLRYNDFEQLCSFFSGSSGESYSNISFYDGGYPDMLIRYDGTAEYATGDYPVPAADAAAEIEEYLDKSIDDKNISVIVKDKDGNVNYLDAEKLLPEKTVYNAPVIKNLSQLKKTLIEGMEFEISDHLRPECVGDHRLITSVNTVGFYSQKLDENGEPSGKDLYMEWEKAKNWTFNGTEYTCRMDNDELLMSFHITGIREKLDNEPVAENISEQSIIENTERTNAEKQTTTVKGNNLNIGDQGTK